MERELMRITTRCDPYAPATVRQALQGLSYGWELGDAMLVATELVTNAVRHSCCSEDQMLTVKLVRTAGRFEISVCDPGRSGSQARLIDRPDGAGGLGLKVVEQIAARWGSERGRRGYRVWAQLPASG
jgi:anti-sigma regulatory factor (Ser/Thr protein kinase)